MTLNERKSLPLWKKFLGFIFGILFFALQLTLIIFFGYFYVNYSKGISIAYVFSEIIGLVLCLYILRKPMNTNYKLTWCILILALPVFFGLLYILNSYSRKLSKRKVNYIRDHVKEIPIKSAKEELLKIDKTGYNFVNVVERDTQAPVYNNSKFIFFSDCYEKHKDMVKELQNAKHYIFMEFFIISNGELMDELFPILLNKGENGVIIRILYDDVGSKGFINNSLMKNLASIPNCEVSSYQPLGLNFNLMANYRDHRKIVVIDDRVAYCGGDNLADEYIHKKERFGYWRDNCGKYLGQCVFSFKAMFYELWFTSTKRTIEIPDTFLSEEYDRFENEGYIMPFGDGPLYKGNPAYNLFYSLIASAKKSIYISTPYFIIDDQMINVICSKCREGVDVKILLPHIPDKKAPFYMARENYRNILKVNGRVYEMTRGFNHAKNIIIDDEYAFIGTINMDYRSLFLHYECGALIMHSKEIESMSKDFLNEINISEEITFEKWKKRPLHQRIISFVLNLFAPMF